MDVQEALARWPLAEVSATVVVEEEAVEAPVVVAASSLFQQGSWVH